MTYAVKEFATILLSDDAQRAAKQLTHAVKLIGESKVFMILFKWPDGVSTDGFAEPEDEFLQTTGTQSGLTVELMRSGKLYALGRPGQGANPVSLVRKDGTSVEVGANEVLSPDAVAELFNEYRDTDSIDTAGWSLREIPLGTDDAAPSGSSAGVSDHGSATHRLAAGTQDRAADEDADGREDGKGGGQS